MLTPRDWKSLRFSKSKLARIAEAALAVATALYLGLAAGFLQLAQEIAAIRNSSLSEVLEQAWAGINPQQSYPGTFVLALEPLIFAILCAAIAAVIGAFFLLLISVRRRNERFVTFLDRYQASFSGTVPEDENIDVLVRSV
jgi:hypothetical protein